MEKEPPPSYEAAVGLETPPAHNPYFVSQQHTSAYPTQPYETPMAVPVPVPVQRVPLPVGPEPIRTSCPVCHKRIKSQIRSKNKYAKHICCFIMLSSGICALCSCLPYFTCPPMKVTHTCPECKAYLGTYKEHS